MKVAHRRFLISSTIICALVFRIICLEHVHKVSVSNADAKRDFQTPVVENPEIPHVVLTSAGIFRNTEELVKIPNTDKKIVHPKIFTVPTELPIVKSVNSVAIATYLAQIEDPEIKGPSWYEKSIWLMLRTLKDQMKTSGVYYDLVVFVIPETCVRARNALKNEGAIVAEINASLLLPTFLKNSDSRHKNQFGKLFLWTLDYKELFFLDGDIYLRGNFQEIFDSIDRNDFDFAAVLDNGSNFGGWIDETKNADPGYINGGMFWCKPSMVTFTHMVQKLDLTQKWHTNLFEQDYLSWYWGRRMQILSPRFNFQLLWNYEENLEIYNTFNSSYLDRVVCWHHKMWVGDIEKPCKWWASDMEKYGISV